MVDFERLQQIPPTGESRAADFDDIVARINAAAWNAAIDPTPVTSAAANAATAVRQAVQVVRDAITVVSNMLQRALVDGWEADLFGSWP
ncbi:MAG: hypothetical protein EBX39_13160, partial [Actinobacteria bacterium]|nr:hypothetical protein [Actinomycetota bacterium]